MRAAVLLQSWTGSAGSGRDEMERARRGHSGHAGCAVRRCGVYSSERAGRRGAGGAATSSCMPLIVQLQSERGVCAGTSTRMKSWPLCLHARGTHAMNTQICALLSLFVTAERASTGDINLMLGGPVARISQRGTRVSEVQRIIRIPVIWHRCRAVLENILARLRVWIVL